ncbi:Adenylate cyclase [hydrothermal vent metagenome]|uniref:Adenylate cyclase n=1 Tax=hydrothermal vent metagenome TaxID=652676 RepID=A0A3B0YT96_9ZZZZ
MNQFTVNLRFSSKSFALLHELYVMNHATRFHIFGYYLLSVLVLTIFSFRSTSTYLGHPKYFIILLIALPYFSAGIVRTLLEPGWLHKAAPLRRARRQLQLDMGLFFLIAASLLCFELFVYDHAIHTAFKTSIWALIIGYFASIDSALHRVRSNQHLDHGDGQPLDNKAALVSQKLNIFLSATVLLVILATTSNAYGYLAPEELFTGTSIDKIKQEFIVETLFVIGIVVTLTTRVIFSYSINLQSMFDNQINTLRKVQEGNLKDYVPVLTEDEFGQIAQQTNLLINQLRGKEKIQRTLEQVVSPDIMQKLLQDSKHDLKKGRQLDVAILFCDLRKFTSYAENKPPDEVIIFLNAYFTKLADVVTEHNGIVNKFLGDAIMAVFGVDGDSRYAEHAVDAAFDILMHSGSALMQDGTTFDIGIGMHCGQAAAGTVGSADRFEYTFIGDSVNTASRLDGLSKRLGYKIISSANIYQRLPEQQKELFSELGEHRIRGKSRPLQLYGAVVDGAAELDGKAVHDNRPNELDPDNS